jgi:hypothetical protein
VTANVNHFRTFARCNVSLLSSMAFVSLVIVGTCLGGNLTLAICLLSFWHYDFYGLAYCFGAVSLAPTPLMYL